MSDSTDLVPGTTPLSIDDRIALKEQEIKDVDTAINDLYLEASQLAGNPIGDRAEGALVVASKVSDTKRQVALIRKKSLDLQDAATNKKNELDRLLREKMELAKLEMKPLQKLLEKLEECIWTFNLYLGRDEVIVPLRTGQRASKDEPISIRQRVLFMDEECQANKEEGGIDSLDIEAFDEWLMASAKNLDQIIPEQKGVVVIRPRFNPKEYKDHWMFEAASEANKIAHFILRNGECVYRISTDFTIGQYLTPKRDEFLRFFRVRKMNPVTLEEEWEELVPGTEAYRKAEEAAGARQRHFYRVALILQGIIDRTPIFHPLKDENTIVTANSSYEQGLIKIIDDDEMVIADSSVSWETFIQDKNQDMSVGMRIIGVFGYSTDHNRKGTKHASDPNPATAYILDKETDEGVFTFSYKNEARNYRTGTAYKNQATYRVTKKDTNIICLDTVTPEEIDLFLTNRKNKRHYATMIPLMRSVRDVLAKEKAEEKPFKDLLVQMMERNNLTFFDIEDEADDLILWYKTKNKIFRPLIPKEQGMESLAWVSVWAELNNRVNNYLAQKKKKEKGEFDAYLQSLLQRYPTAVLIAHEKGRTYKVVVPHETSKVYVKVITSNSIEDNVEEWVLPRKSMLRWYVLYKHGFEKYKLFEKYTDHLTDPEKEYIATNAFEYYKEQMAHYRSVPKFDKPSDIGVFCITQSANGKCSIYREKERAKINEAFYYTGDNELPEIGIYHISANKTKRGKIELEMRQTTLYRDDVEKCTWNKALEVTEYCYVVEEGNKTPVKTVYFDHVLEQRIRQEIVIVSETTKKYRRIRAIIESIMRSLRTQWDEAFYAVEYQKYMDDFHDEGRWEGHKKTLRTPSFPINTSSSWGSQYYNHAAIDLGIPMMLERGHQIEGITFMELCRLSKHLLETTLQEYPLSWLNKVNKDFPNHGSMEKYYHIPRGMHDFKIKWSNV